MNRSGHVIHHPAEIPIEVLPVDSGGGKRLSRRRARLPALVFDFPHKLHVGTTVTVSIPNVQKETQIRGRIIWLARRRCGYIVGMAFLTENDAFRMRMLEQACHIEVYRKVIRACEGRELTTEQAAAEWISSHAADFPGLLPLAA